MKSLFSTLILSVVLVACSSPEREQNFTVQGTIKGLKVGKVLLQKVQDTTLVTLDSMSLDGSSDYRLSSYLEEPQMLFLYLDVKDGSTYDDRIAFFAEDTVMTINSTLANFEEDAVINGSKNQELLSVFNDNLRKLNQTYTELMKRSMTLSQKENPSQAEIDALNNDYDKYLTKKVLYAISYAAVHKENEVAPYILLKEGFDANPKLLDSIYNLMPKKIQTSLYGKDLSELITIKKEEN